jgi:hypothetical protein
LGHGYVEKDARRVSRDNVNTLPVVGRLQPAPSLRCELHVLKDQRSPKV